jgi:hypothetical protein
MVSLASPRYCSTTKPRSVLAIHLLPAAVILVLLAPNIALPPNLSLFQLHLVPAALVSPASPRYCNITKPLSVLATSCTGSGYFSPAISKGIAVSPLYVLATYCTGNDG